MSCFACFPSFRAAGRELRETSTRDPHFFGQYESLRVIGHGEFGTVSLAHDAVSGRKVAVKWLINDQRASDLAAEIAIHRRLQHPNVVAVLDVIVTKQYSCFVMEFASRGDLIEYIRDKGYVSDVAGRRYFQQLIAGVAYCHDSRIAHRDLKLDNLLVDQDGYLKIADFGFAREMIDGVVRDTPKGSPHYFAPELLAPGLAHYLGEPADLYSCGIILYCLLCGNFPFASDSMSGTNEQLFKAVKRGRFVVPKHVSGGAEALLQKLITVSLIDRLTIPEICKRTWFKTDLEQLAQPKADNSVLLGRSFTNKLELADVVIHAAAVVA